MRSKGIKKFRPNNDEAFALTERETEGEEHLEVPPDKDVPYKFNREDRGSSRRTTKRPEHPS